MRVEQPGSDIQKPERGAFSSNLQASSSPNFHHRQRPTSNEAFTLVRGTDKRTTPDYYAFPFVNRYRATCGRCLVYSEYLVQA